ncbi:hypothetical protein BH11ARM1_BH11ARM1_04650 [soil metagenome]
MDGITGNLWEYNLARVIVVDVTDDYLLMQPPLPSYFYPVLREVWLPKHQLGRTFPHDDLVPGYLYDWHETPESDLGSWYVGVVDANLNGDLIH